MKYALGDKVKIKEDLLAGHAYGLSTVRYDMLKYCGKSAEIVGIRDCSYDLDIDGGSFYWTDEMLEDCEGGTVKFKVGDTVRVKLGLKGGKDYERELGLDDFYFNPDMERFCGKETVVTYVNEDRGTYKLSCDAEYWAWTIGMLEPVEEEVSTPTNEVTIDMDKLNKEDRETIQKIVDKQNNPFDIPNHIHDYYYISVIGTINRYTWMNDPVDFELYMSGNYYLTKEEAKFALEKRQIIRKLEILAKKAGGVDWRKSIKYSMWYDHDDDFLSVTTTRGIHDLGQIYFPTEESCQQAINIVGETSIKKYLFGVED